MASKPGRKGKEVMPPESTAASSSSSTSSVHTTASNNSQEKELEKNSTIVKRKASFSKTQPQHGKQVVTANPATLGKKQPTGENSNLVVKKQQPFQQAETSGEVPQAVKSKLPKVVPWEFEDSTWDFNEDEIEGIKVKTPNLVKVSKNYRSGSKKVSKARRKSQVSLDEDMTDDVDKHVLRKYQVHQKLGKGVSL
jgi:hypothetical protein